MVTNQRIERLLRIYVREGAIPSWAYVVGLGVVIGTGLGTLCVHLFHLFTVDDGLYTTALGTLLPITISLVLIGTGAWIHWQGFGDVALRIGAWCVAGSVMLVCVSVVSFAYQDSKDLVMVDLPFVLANHATVGAFMGTLVGIYDGQRVERAGELDDERTRARRMGNRLTILNRVLRHDIRNAVNVILGHTERIRMNGGEPLGALDKIDAEALHLVSLSDRARQLEQSLEHGPVDMSTFDVAALLRQNVQLIQEEHPEIDVEVDLPESVVVRANPLIESAFSELLENAIEHNDADTPHLVVSASTRSGRLDSDTGTGEVVTIRIHDNGPGIPNGEIEVLERGRETALSHTSGIGLWFVRWVVSASGGQVAFETGQRRGSAIEVRLPRPHEPQKGTGGTGGGEDPNHDV